MPDMSARQQEIRGLLGLSEQDVLERAGCRLVVCEDLDALHRRFAEDVAAEIRAASAAGRPCRLILPVGPTGQYPILADVLNAERLSLSGCHFYFMDEYCDQSGRAFAADHPLSFKRTAAGTFLGRLDPDLGLPQRQVVFPDEANVGGLADRIEQGGGIDACFGGIGIHGHLAFNEPAAGVAESGPRLVELNDFTVTINAVRAHVGGNLACFPRRALTLGMRQILSAGKIRLYCRNGCEFDWANTVLRLALFGRPGDDYPVTHLRNHPNHVICTDRDTLAAPENFI